MTKLEIVNMLYEKLGFSKRECAHIVDSFFEVIKGIFQEVKAMGFIKLPELYMILP